MYVCVDDEIRKLNFGSHLFDKKKADSSTTRIIPTSSLEEPSISSHRSGRSGGGGGDVGGKHTGVAGMGEMKKTAGRGGKNRKDLRSNNFIPKPPKSKASNMKGKNPKLTNNGTALKDAKKRRSRLASSASVKQKEENLKRSSVLSTKMVDDKNNKPKYVATKIMLCTIVLLHIHIYSHKVCSNLCFAFFQTTDCEKWKVP